MEWALYCRVVDNFGDVGVAWRLASDLAGRGERVRLCIDDASALAWMAPGGADGVTVAPWDDAAGSAADVVVELFGAGLPERAASAVAVAASPPVCINLEHLTAEGFARRAHGLPSPRRAASGRTTTTWFFYPGFEAGTGGLLREPGVLDRSTAAASGDAHAWLASFGIAAEPGERLVSLFAYPHNAALPELLDALSSRPTLLLLPPGGASDEAAALLGPQRRRNRLRAARLPFLAQPAFDLLLASCDLNLVRGEDSPVRAIWAGQPCLWQLYPQGDGAHAAKLDAFLDVFLHHAPAAWARPVRDMHRRWNGLGTAGALEALGDDGSGGGGLMDAWRHHLAGWRRSLAARPDLTSALLEFVHSKR